MRGGLCKGKKVRVNNRAEVEGMGQLTIDVPLRDLKD
jgi:hypothetical protein